IIIYRPQVMPMAHHNHNHGHNHHSLTQLVTCTTPPRYVCQQQQLQQQLQSPLLRRSLSGGRLGAADTAARAKSHQRAGSESASSSSRAAHACLAGLASSGAESLPSPPITASSAETPGGGGDDEPVGVGLRAPGDSAFRPRKRSLSVGGEQACGDFFARQIEQYGLAALLTSPVGTCFLLASAVLSYSPEIVL
ncbi:hypothetical protein GGI21_006686, partial [Coemansia aciculifera]